MNKDLKAYLFCLVSISSIAGFLAWKEDRCFQNGGEVWECSTFSRSTWIFDRPDPDPCEVALNTHGRHIRGCGR
jgi:hypothetical protein